MPTYRLPDSERSLFSLYDAANVGSDAPPAFHRWCLAAVIGAVASPFVHAYTVPDQPVTPDIRVFLITKSGGGKGKAIGRAMTLVRDLTYPAGRIFCVDGSMTKALFVKTIDEFQHKLRDEGVTDWNVAPILLVHQELLDDLGTYESARQFISYITNISSRHTDTHTHGSIYSGGVHKTRGIAASWIGGTTIEWLRRAYDPDAIKSGAFSRIIPVYVPKEEVPDQRAFEPYPHDFEQTMYDIRSRLADLTALRGAFRWDENAMDVYRAGVERREEERDPAMDAAWSREREYVLKLAMILSLASHRASELVLRPEDIAEAQRTVRKTFEAAGPIYHVASETRETAGLHEVEEYIRRKKSVRERVFFQWVKQSGLTPELVKRHIVFLVQAGTIRKELAPQPIGTQLVWRGRRG